MISILERLEAVPQRWREGSLTALLAVQVVTVFGLVPGAASGLPLPPGLAAALLLVVMSLTTVLAHGRWAPALGVSMLLLGGATAMLQGWIGGRQARVAGEVAGLLTFLLLGAVVLGAVFGPGRFTGHRIRGAVVLYLNLGLLFAFLHRILAEVLCHAYDHLPPQDQVAAFRAASDYLSFSTLTSVGYGDIVPVQPLARALCTLEAALGQLVPTVLIARVVTLAARQIEAEEEGDRPPKA